MKKKTTALVITTLLSLAFLPQFISYALNTLFQQPETGWAVWETETPVQRIARVGKIVETTGNAVLGHSLGEVITAIRSVLTGALKLWDNFK